MKTSSTTVPPKPKTNQADRKRKLSLPASLSTHTMTTRQQLKRKLSEAQPVTKHHEKTEEDPDIRKLDLAEAMEKLPGWRPPARKKRVVVESEEEDNE